MIKTKKITSLVACCTFLLLQFFILCKNFLSSLCGSAGLQATQKICGMMPNSITPNGLPLTKEAASKNF